MVRANRVFANMTGRVMIGTDWKGWSSDGDFDALTYSLINVEYFQHQQERHLQSIVNNLAMMRTFTGVCADLPEFQHEGTNLSGPRRGVFESFFRQIMNRNVARLRAGG